MFVKYYITYYNLNVTPYFYVCYTWAFSNISPKELHRCHCFNWSSKYDQQGALLTFQLTSAEIQMNLKLVTLVVKSIFVVAVM